MKMCKMLQSKSHLQQLHVVQNYCLYANMQISKGLIAFQENNRNAWFKIHVEAFQFYHASREKIF